MHVCMCERMHVCMYICMYIMVKSAVFRSSDALRLKIPH